MSAIHGEPSGPRPPRAGGAATGGALEKTLRIIEALTEETDLIARITGLPALTPRTLTGRRRLHADLAAVRERGHAVDDQEHEASVRCLGVPLFDRDGTPVGGVGLTTTASLTTRRELERLAPALTQAARGVERLLRLG
ncbi:IclR family transcriptional regulator C-terminal domain-containing protein [Streptomyces sp. NPDC059564]|uniref:IclR family transcriptional regulator domain-containing protein n=1 Tax=Streptomyces sp. NPDC059564 TaxID=3346865 RepID=UPI0036A68C0C